jgi:hypothetical protein
MCQSVGIPDMLRSSTSAATSDQSYGSSGGHQQGWVEKCIQINQKILENCGLDRQWFDQPVQRQYIPDYYDKVASPMDLGTIQNKLDNGKYRNPEGFCRVIFHPLYPPSLKGPLPSQQSFASVQTAFNEFLNNQKNQFSLPCVSSSG